MRRIEPSFLPKVCRDEAHRALPSFTRFTVGGQLCYAQSLTFLTLLGETSAQRGAISAVIPVSLLVDIPGFGRIITVLSTL